MLSNNVVLMLAFTKLTNIKSIVATFTPSYKCSMLAL
jgi:hypothetical protein